MTILRRARESQNNSKALAEHHGAAGFLRSTASSTISLKMSSKLLCFLPTDITVTSNLLALKEFGGGVRQLSRITGVSYGIIQRI